eukprot:CAMPEP_0176064804 /NCGR_PEP_ID=MMETSP0120_2-20121206/32326_1 /TAXON_ID=160619 /ORGANISM="Kryptoperidinium foliaceum, Strain CCMP 1326" /LENGTH=190 /DNA_ID=CAMNT_0017398385 /DNA_START=111 /DNA_END=682 /DNA_ORIENTATION=+
MPIAQLDQHDLGGGEHDALPDDVPTDKSTVLVRQRDVQMARCHIAPADTCSANQRNDLEALGQLFRGSEFGVLASALAMRSFAEVKEPTQVTIAAERIPRSCTYLSNADLSSSPGAKRNAQKRPWLRPCSTLPDRRRPWRPCRPRRASEKAADAPAKALRTIAGTISMAPAASPQSNTDFPADSRRHRCS